MNAPKYEFKSVSAGFFYYVQAWFGIIYDVLFQRWHTRHVPSPGAVCHSSIAGKICIVTGSTSGIGKETARLLALAGARVIMACRNVPRGEMLATQWQKDAKQATGQVLDIKVMKLDLSSSSSVRAFAAEIEMKRIPLHVLIHNAGIFSIGASRRESLDGHEDHLGTNYLNPFLLTILILPSLKRAAPGRIVNVSSELHKLGALYFEDMCFETSRYTNLKAYSQSKLAQVVLTEELMRRFPSQLEVFAVHPGNVITDVVRTLPGLMQRLYRFALRRVLLSPEEGARSLLYAASSPDAPLAATAGGRYISSDLRHHAPNPLAHDKTVGSQLWDVSLQMVQMEPSMVGESCADYFGYQ
eukprot:jgi/Mesvir1/12775/Mv22831-RA.1